nr:integrase, catalytic region, zinc finger, CCHC-type, peptidase aspartic, catalytic [Tanacetum cinerariifolium]
MLLTKKDKDEQVLLAKDQAQMESSSDSDQEINANMVFMDQIKKFLSGSEASSSSADEKISEIVQICLWIIDSGCSKHMTSNYVLLTNFVEKFLGTVRFGNNDFAMIAGYGDEIQVAQKKVKIAFENAYSSSRVELIPSKIKYAIKVILNFHKEFSVFSSISRKENDGLL